MKPTRPRSLAALTVTAALATVTTLAGMAAHAEELFVDIHSGSPMAQGAGLVLAGQAPA